MASLVQPCKYVVINTAVTTKNRFYVTQLISEAYTLQNNKNIDGQVISAGKLVAKTQYLCSRQENTNRYSKQQSFQHNIIVSTFTILHPCLDVVRITDVQYTPKNIYNMIQSKKFIQRHPIFMTDAYYDYTLDEIERQEKIEFESNVSVNSDKE